MAETEKKQVKLNVPDKSQSYWNNILPNGLSPMQIKEYFQQSIRPWSVFFAIKNLKPATTLAGTQRHIVQNFNFFEANYICITIILSIYYIIRSPKILLVLFSCACGKYLIQRLNRPVKIINMLLSPKLQMIIVNSVSVILLFVSGADTVLFWILGASLCLNGLHAIFYNIEAITSPLT